MTYAQFADGATGSRRCCGSRGVGKGDRVAYLGENSPEFLQVIFGAAQLGAVFVPVNTRLAPPEIAYVLADCGARVLIHDPDFADRWPAARRPPGAPARRSSPARARGPAGAGPPDPDRRAGPPAEPTSASRTRRRSSTPRARPAGPRVPC